MSKSPRKRTLSVSEEDTVKTAKKGSPGKTVKKESPRKTVTVSTTRKASPERRPKTLALIISSHGDIPIHFTHSKPLHEIVRVVDIHQFNIETLYVLSLANLAGVCYGVSIDADHVKRMNTHFKNHPKPTFEKVEDLLKNRFPASIAEHNRRLFGHRTLQLSNVGGAFIDKVYTKYDEKSGIFLYSMEGFDTDEKKFIKDSIEEMTRRILGGRLFRGEIFDRFKDLNIDYFYLIDLNCDSYLQTNTAHTFTQAEAGWLTEQLLHMNLRG